MSKPEFHTQILNRADKIKRFTHMLIGLRLTFQVPCFQNLVKNMFHQNETIDQELGNLIRDQEKENTQDSGRKVPGRQLCKTPGKESHPGLGSTEGSRRGR